MGCDRPWLTFALGRHDCERAMCDNAKGFCVIMIRCTDYGQFDGSLSLSLRIESVCARSGGRCGTRDSTARTRRVLRLRDGLVTIQMLDISGLRVLLENLWTLQ